MGIVFNIIVILLTLGVGSFEWRFDHLQELTGKTAEKVIEARKEALAAQ